MFRAQRLTGVVNGIDKTNQDYKPKTVCVVGLGPSGIVAVKELKAVGLKVTGYDAASGIGGRWAAEPAYDMGVWEELCFNGGRRSNCFTDFPWNKEDFPSEITQKARHGIFPHNSEARMYYEAYAKHNHLYPCFQLNTRVTGMEQVSGDKWKVSIQTKDGQVSEQIFDYFVGCPGRQHKGRNQLKDNQLKSFTGQVMHSCEMKTTTAFKGKRVLVIGASVSGSDISSELARNGECAKVVNSVRRVPYHVDRLTHDGESIDEVMWKRLPVWLGRYLPDSAVFQGLKAEILKSWPDQLTDGCAGEGLVPDPDIIKAGVGVASHYVKCVREKKLSLKLGVESAEGNTVIFVDGSKEDFDLIICATGYDADVSFLPQNIQDKILYESPYTKSKETALYKYTLVPGVETIGLVGMFYAIGPCVMAFEMQARYLAAIWSGKLKRPSDKAIDNGIAAFKRYRQAGKHNHAELSSKVAEELGDELGLTPSTLSAVCHAKTLLVGPLYGVQYRFKDDDKQVAKASRDKFDEWQKSREVAEWTTL